MRTTLFTLVVFTASSAIAAEVAPAPRVIFDFTGYVLAKDAKPADPKVFRATTTTVPVPGYIGVSLGSTSDRKPLIDDIAPDSPAELAGLKRGDVVVKCDDVAYGTSAQLRDRLRGLVPNERIVFSIERNGTARQISIMPKPASVPLSATAPPRAIIGVRTNPVRNEGGAEVDSVTPGGSADQAGLRSGDIILKIDSKEINQNLGVFEALAAKKPDELVTLTIKRGNAEKQLSVKLQASPAITGRSGGWDDRQAAVWSKPKYRLAIVGVEFPDVKQNPKITPKDWEASLFSKGKYQKSVTGQTTYGSLADYYREISYGKLDVEGAFVGWVTVSKKRNDYAAGSGGNAKEPFLKEATDAVLATHGREALKDFDGIFFVFAGNTVQTNRGGLFWPHKASFTHQNKRWMYFIVPEGGNQMTNISVICHEFGHMLGIRDLYARPEDPGSEGLGIWCAMSNQVSNGRPQHFSAWPKEQLGWVKPITVDPRVKQKIILNPIEDDPTACIKIPVRPDGSEYFLLENRRKKGFDNSLPAEGLLIWRIVSGKVTLEESHGVEGPNGPRLHSASIPYPSASNSSFTPYTTPSSKGQLGGGLDVYITNIRMAPDGRIVLQIGYEYQ